MIIIMHQILALDNLKGVDVPLNKPNQLFSVFVWINKKKRIAGQIL